MGKHKVNCSKGTREAGLDHAVLSASSSHRWLHCPPSIRLSEKYEDMTSSYAAEGTDAHELCEHRLKELLSLPTENPVDSLSYYSEEMEECANSYATYILELVESAKANCFDPIILIEQRVDFSAYVPDGFGTADCIIISDGVLKVVDYKHGMGVEVSAEENPQMMCYAIGALELFDGIYDIDRISMTIYQPRRDNISNYEVTKSELLKWATEVLQPSAELAFAGEGEFQYGDWCGFCKAKHECRKRAEANMALAKYDFELPPTLSDEDIEEILGMVDGLTSWASDIKDYALARAISGKKWNGYKLVEGRSNRKYINEKSVADAVTVIGYDPYEKKLLGITAMQKLLGKSRFDEVLSTYIEKPKGKPALALASDKRKEINTVANDFATERNEEN